MKFPREVVYLKVFQPIGSSKKFLTPCMLSRTILETSPTRIIEEHHRKNQINFDRDLITIRNQYDVLKTGEAGGFITKDQLRT